EVPVRLIAPVIEESTGTGAALGEQVAVVVGRDGLLRMIVRLAQDDGPLDVVRRRRHAIVGGGDERLLRLCGGKVSALTCECGKASKRELYFHGIPTKQPACHDEPARFSALARRREATIACRAGFAYRGACRGESSSRAMRSALKAT